jgi:hypothetical protein
MMATDKPKTRKSKAKGGNQSGVNAKEIKAWLRGILEFQPAGWAPNAEQWDSIKERIFMLEEVDTTSSPEVNMVSRHQEHVQQHYQPHVQSYVPERAYRNRDENQDDGRVSVSSPLATSTSPTETGVVQVKVDPNAADYKSPF